MTVTVKEVRDFLNNLSEQRVPPETVAKQIEVATEKITNESASAVTATTKNTAILVYASYLTYFAYVTEYERSAGVVPGFMVGHLELLRQLAEGFLRYAGKGSPTFLPEVAVTESLEE